MSGQGHVDFSINALERNQVDGVELFKNGFEVAVDAFQAGLCAQAFKEHPAVYSDGADSALHAVDFDVAVDGYDVVEACVRRHFDFVIDGGGVAAAQAEAGIFGLDPEPAGFGGNLDVYGVQIGLPGSTLDGVDLNLRLFPSGNADLAINVLQADEAIGGQG